MSALRQRCDLCCAALQTMEEAAAVWIRDEDEGWLPGVVKKVDDDQIEVDVVDDDGTTIEAITLPMEEIKRRDADAKPVDDLISLAVLHIHDTSKTHSRHI